MLELRFCVFLVSYSIEDLIRHLEAYVAAYPADFMHVIHMALGFGVFEQVLPLIGASLSLLLHVPTPTIVDTIRSTIQPEPSSSNRTTILPLCLLYGGYTSDDPIIRLQEDEKQPTRWSNFMGCAAFLDSAPSLEIYQVLDEGRAAGPFREDLVIAETERLSGSFRENPVISETERLLVDAIPSWKRLNSAAGGARDVWHPSTSELQVRPHSDGTHANR